MKLCLLLYFLTLTLYTFAQSDEHYFIKGEEVRLTKGHFWSKPTSLSTSLSDDEYLEDAVALGSIYDRFLTVASDTLINGYVKVIDYDENNRKIVGWIYAKNVEQKPIPRLIGSSLDTTYCLQYLDNIEWKKYNDENRYSSILHAKLHTYLADAYSKYGMHAKAIFTYTQSINLYPNDYSKIKRAFSKLELKDYQGVINDVDNIIIKKDDIRWAYDEPWIIYNKQEEILNLEGFCKLNLKIYNAARIDLDKSILIDSQSNPMAYYYRAICFLNMNQKEKACNDFSKAGEQGYTDAYNAIDKYCH